MVISDMRGKNMRPLIGAPRGVTGFALSPNRTQVMYARENADMGVPLWLVRMDGSRACELVSCAPADCSQPVWSPDGSKVVYERLDLTSSGGLGLPTLWWLDMTNGKADTAGIPGNTIAGNQFTLVTRRGLAELQRVKQQHPSASSDNRRESQLKQHSGHGNGLVSRQ